MRAPELLDGVKMVSLVFPTLMDTRTWPSVFGTKKSTIPNRFDPVMEAGGRQLIWCSAYLKERLFGLSNPQGNHGESVKEAHFHVDNTPVS